MRLLAQLTRWAERWIPEECAEPLSAGFLRARLLLTLTAAWSGMCLWSFGYQLLRGAPAFALVALGSLLLAGAVPVLLRRTGSLTLAGNVLTCAPFLGLSAANFASGGQAVASVIMLAFVPLVAALVTGRRSACVWTGAVCLQLLALPWLQSLGMPALIEPSPQAAEAAIFRAPLLGALFLLAGIFAYEAVTEQSFRFDELFQRLQRSEQQHRQLADTSPNGICTTRKGIVAYANPALLKLLGVESIDAVRGRRLLDLVHPDDHDGLGQLTSAVHAGTTLPASEMRLRRPGGGECAVEAALATTVGNGGDEGLCVFHDLTNRKLLEEQVRQSQKTEAIGQLAGGVAHDFNNLLTVILGEAEALLLDPAVASDEQRRLGLEGIREAGERSAALTHKLLAFSRRQILQPSVLDLNDVVSGLLDMLRRLVPETIDIDAALEPSLALAKADPVQLEQVLLNLVLNARDAGARRIVLATRNVSQGARAGRPDVQLSVSDDGCGMDAETRERAFDPFFTTKAPGSGTGLGLATVHGIVHQSGGNIEIESECDKGTTVRINLPSEVGAASVVASHDARRTASAGGGSETVLLVEDEPSVRRVVAITLRSAGYHVLEACDGVDALAVVRRRSDPIHLVVSDLVMPNMGGAEVVERLRAEAPDLAVLFISGYGGHSPLGEGGKRHPLLHKPFTGGELVAEARRVLDTAGA